VAEVIKFKKELRPLSCPFCEAKSNQLFVYLGEEDIHVECGQCLAFGPTAETELKAIELWNKAHE